MSRKMEHMAVRRLANFGTARKRQGKGSTSRSGAQPISAGAPVVEENGAHGGPAPSQFRRGLRLSRKMEKMEIWRLANFGTARKRLPRCFALPPRHPIRHHWAREVNRRRGKWSIWRSGAQPIAGGQQAPSIMGHAAGGCATDSGTTRTPPPEQSPRGPAAHVSASHGAAAPGLLGGRLLGRRTRFEDVVDGAT